MAAIETFFEGKPESHAIFGIVADRIQALGPCEVEVASQISFRGKRKFAWFWLYNVTQRNPNGVPHLMLALDRGMPSDRVRHIDQIGNNRWNHQIVIRTREDAMSRWLGELLGLAHAYGTK